MTKLYDREDIMEAMDAAIEAMDEGGADKVDIAKMRMFAELSVLYLDGVKV